MENDPKILHLSFRESDPDNEYRWLYVNIVFKVFAEEDIAVCNNYSDRWVKNTLFEVESSEEVDLHYQHTTYKFIPLSESSQLSTMESFTDPEYDILDKKRTGWSYNFDEFLSKAKKPNTYFYREYVEDNVVTRAALHLLQEMKDGKESGSRFVPFSALHRSLKVLNTFWD